MDEQKRRVLELIRSAFADVTLGEGIGFWEGQGIDDYVAADVLAALRLKDEKLDWSMINPEDLDACYSSVSFFDSDGMRFHLPAYLIADLNGELFTADVTHHLFGSVGGAHSQFESLSASQRHAVREFLLYRLSLPCEFERPMIEAALRDHWIEPVA